MIFDLDGTLVDSAADLAASVNVALGSVGLPPLPRATIVGFVGNGTRRLVEGSIRTADPGVAEDRVERAYAAFRGHYAEHLLRETRLYPGVAAMLDGISAAGAGVSVLTNKPRAESERILRGLGVGERFDAVLGGDDPAGRKPAPDGLLRLLRERRLSPDECLLVGDSGVDLETARAARVPFCGVTWGFRGAEELRARGATWLVDRPDEIVEKILGRRG